MTDKEPRALIPLPPGGLANIGSGPQSILSGMVSDALALARVREKSLADKRFRIGEYEFRDPDYRQILIWAEVLNINPESVLRRLQCCTHNMGVDFEKIDCHNSLCKNFDEETYQKAKPFFQAGCQAFQDVGVGLYNLFEMLIKKFGENIKNYIFRFIEEENLMIQLEDKSSDLQELLKNIVFKVEDGRIVTLLWDFDCLPINFFKWIDGLEIKTLGFQGSSTSPLSLHLHSLNKLYCSNIGITELDLSNVPKLEELWCVNNKISELDICGLEFLTEFEFDPFVIIKKLPTQNF